MAKRKYFLEGQLFGDLRVISFHGNKFLCECRCGNARNFYGRDLIRGNCKSCGCRRNINDPSYEQRFKKRFFSFVKKSGNLCWEWLGCKHSEGYGRISYRGKVQKAPRIMWRLRFGEIPKKMIICHHCDNPSCVNPGHLFLGTDATNNLDCVAKGRHKCKKGSENPFSKLHEEQVLLIKQLLVSHIAVSEIMKKFNVARTTIHNIKNGKTWKHVAL